MVNTYRTSSVTSLAARESCGISRLAPCSKRFREVEKETQVACRDYYLRFANAVLMESQRVESTTTFLRTQKKRGAVIVKFRRMSVSSAVCLRRLLNEKKTPCSNFCDRIVCALCGATAIKQTNNTQL